MLLLIALETSK